MFAAPKHQLRILSHYCECRLQFLADVLPDVGIERVGRRLMCLDDLECGGLAAPQLELHNGRHRRAILELQVYKAAKAGEVVGRDWSHRHAGTKGECEGAIAHLQPPSCVRPIFIVEAGSSLQFLGGKLDRRSLLFLRTQAVGEIYIGNTAAEAVWALSLPGCRARWSQTAPPGTT